VVKERYMRGLFAAVLLLPGVALAQAVVAVPQTIGYQGKLLRADGTPENGKNVQLTFTICDAETGGTVKLTVTTAGSSSRSATGRRSSRASASPRWRTP
jgi:hypothetical protein